MGGVRGLKLELRQRTLIDVGDVSSARAPCGPAHGELAG